MLLRLQISVFLVFALSQTSLTLTNFVEKSSNTYDIKLIYYETTFQKGSNDTH